MLIKLTSSTTIKYCLSLFLILNLVLFHHVLFLRINSVNAAPLIPILTAIATSAASLFQIQVDTLHIAKYLRAASNCKRNRASFVRDLLYTAFYRSGQTHNVMVFNLAEEHHQRLYGVVFYGSIGYIDGTRFGVWVFESGVFENHGARGWHNWGMIGSFKKSKNGETIYFQRRHKLWQQQHKQQSEQSTMLNVDGDNKVTTIKSNENVIPTSIESSRNFNITILKTNSSFSSSTENLTMITTTPAILNFTTTITTNITTNKPPLTIKFDLLSDFSDVNGSISTLIQLDNVEIMNNLISGVNNGVNNNDYEDDDNKKIKIENNLSIPKLNEKKNIDKNNNNKQTKVSNGQNNNKRSVMSKSNRIRSA